MDADLASLSGALIQSLLQGPLLLQDLPEAKTLELSSLQLPARLPKLNAAQKLGHLYEDALAVLLETSPRYDLLEESLQIQKDVHTTVGELDFLIRDRMNDELIHLELATKFYLAVGSPEGITLPGPDARDNYHKKLKRLREHQLTLTQAYRHCLPECYRHEPVATRQLVYGCLFDHIQANEQATPELANPHCRRGLWLHDSECLDYFPQHSQFQIIPKPLWPVPLEFLTGIELERWAPAQSISRCIMVRYNDEPSPYFIAPAGYPAT